MRKQWIQPRTRIVAEACAIAVGLLVASGSGVCDDASKVQPNGGAAGAGEVHFSGRVIDKDGEAPIVNAAITVSRLVHGGAQTDVPAWVGETTLHTDGDGRFTIRFTPDQLTDPRLLIALRTVAHPEYITRSMAPVPVRGLIHSRECGDRWAFETLKLERGLEYTGVVVTPDGRPAQGVPYECENHSESNLVRGISDELRGRTDHEGRIRLRMPKTQTLAIRLTPDDHAPFVRYWGTLNPKKDPDIWGPLDLGRISLVEGATLSGRLLNLRGEPVPGQRVRAIGPDRVDQRLATTGNDGSFTFAPLAPGEYEVVADGQSHGPYFDPAEGSQTSPYRVVRPQSVLVSQQPGTPKVVLREVPSVRVEVRLVDSEGRPSRTGTATITGSLPNDPVQPAGPKDVRPEAIAQQPGRVARLPWGVQLAPDANGLVDFRVPQGLRDAELLASPLDETVAVKTRLEPGGALKFWGGGTLGDLGADRTGITIFVYRAPTVVINVETEDGSEPFQESTVEVGFISRGYAFSEGVIRQADGRFRTISLMPHHEYRLTAHAAGYVPSLLRRVNLAEGASEEMTLFIKPTPEAPRNGDQAPPFSVTTSDGRPLATGDFEGKFLLLHFWNPLFEQTRADMPRIQAVQQRFGGDGRLKILGLCLVDDPNDAAKAIDKFGIRWPQAVLRDDSFDPMAVDYGVTSVPRTFLIGPMGRIVAADLKGAQVVDAVAAALAEP